MKSYSHNLKKNIINFGRFDTFGQKVEQIKLLLLRLIKKFQLLGDRKRRSLLIILDIFILFFATYVAFVLRFDDPLPIEKIQNFRIGIILTVLVKIVFFFAFGMYRPLLRHSGLEMLEIILKVTLLTDGFIILSSSLFLPSILPRTVQIIGALIAIFLIISSRLTIRSVIWRTTSLSIVPRRLQRQFYNSTNSRSKELTKIIIYGAGVTGYQVSQNLDLEKQYKIIGFIDDNHLLHGRELNRIKIYHSENLKTLIYENGVEQVLLAIPSATAQQKSAVIETLQNYNISIKTVPSAREILSGKVSLATIRNIDIADLLGREEVIPDPHLLRADIERKNVLVTGAGGSIGSEICRQIAELNPKELVLLDSSEFSLYSIELELREQCPQISIKAYLCSVLEARSLQEIFIKHKTQTIYHAAAYKHVPLVEENPAQGILNNTYGTLLTAKTAQNCGVQTFVLISTDKAVRPTNVMGASKRAAELVLQALAARNSQKTRFIMVRFGNVLGSSGSVVPRFRKQIANGEPITLTHPNITRFFMTIPEAARLVIQAGAMGIGGDVFLLDMGEPVKIYDLALKIIKLSGLKPGKDVDIKITGLRPGEKLYEELLINGENVSKTKHPKIFSAREHMIDWETLEPMLNQLFDAAQLNDHDKIKQMLKKIVPEYQVSFIPQPLKA